MHECTLVWMSVCVHARALVCVSLPGCVLLRLVRLFGVCVCACFLCKIIVHLRYVVVFSLFALFCSSLAVVPRMTVTVSVGNPVRSYLTHGLMRVGIRALHCFNSLQVHGRVPVPSCGQMPAVQKQLACPNRMYVSCLAAACARVWASRHGTCMQSWLLG